MGGNDFQIGQWVKILDWCGRIVDIAKSDTRTMMQIRSFKGIWNHHPDEWLEYREGMMRCATPDEVARDRERYTEHVRRALDAIEQLEMSHAEA